VVQGKTPQNEASLVFKQTFLDEVEALPDHEELDQELFESMIPQGEELAKHAIPALDEYFGKFKLVGVEDYLYENIEKRDLDIGNRKFKGFIDLIIKTEDGKYHVIDWKTCGWGWDAERRREKMTTYQLTLYKHFFAKKYEFDPKDIETYFALLKRTAKKDQVEIFRVTSGPKKTNNALNLLHRAVYNLSLIHI
jgi:ATP-dependent exoDNAse (exonuclease V) beta subunit